MIERLPPRTLSDAELELDEPTATANARADAWRSEDARRARLQRDAAEARLADATALAHEAYHYQNRLPTDFVYRLRTFISGQPAAPTRAEPTLDDGLAYIRKQAKRTEAEQAVLDAMGTASVIDLRSHICKDLEGHWSYAACAAELARRGLE